MEDLLLCKKERLKLKWGSGIKDEYGEWIGWNVECNCAWHQLGWRGDDKEGGRVLDTASVGERVT